MTRWCWALTAAGCGLPDLVQVEARLGDEAVDQIVTAEVDETVFRDDLPVEVVFGLAFDEAMDLTSARDHVWIEDEDGGELGVDLEARLDTIEVLPEEPLAPGQNHTLVIEAGVTDNAGNQMLHGYRVAFYTADEP